MKKVLYVTGSRADYGLMRKVLLAIHDDPDIDLSVAVLGMHLMEAYHSLDEIKKDGLAYFNLGVAQHSSDRKAMATFTAESLGAICELCSQLQPDLILLLGDRAEMMAGALAGTYLGIAVAHIHGGEVSSTVDESIRHAITKLAHIHLPATEDSSRRIRKMGEREELIYVVGAPGLEGLEAETLSREQLCKALGLNVEAPVVLILFHPVSEEIDSAESQMQCVLKSCEEIDAQKVIIYPNADAGSGEMIDVIREYEAKSNYHAFGNVSRKHFLSLMKHSEFMIGNSSSGLIEAPSFFLPVINVGTRQSGRLKGLNVVDAACEEQSLDMAIRKISDRDFRVSLANAKNPYGDGKTSERVLRVIKSVDLKSILQKQITY
ncbi:MAG: UDP-N-acetylglucosamine 2-epimerase [Marinoscillum sp.]